MCEKAISNDKDERLTAHTQHSRVGRSQIQLIQSTQREKTNLWCQKLGSECSLGWVRDLQEAQRALHSVVFDLGAGYTVVFSL